MFIRIFTMWTESRTRSQAVARIADRTGSQLHYVSTVRRFDNPKIR